MTGFDVLGPMERTNNRIDLSIFDEDDIAGGHYRQIRGDGGPEGRTKCFLLHSREDEQFVGFLGVDYAAEDLDSLINAYYSIDYVYVRPAWRGRGASRVLRDAVQSMVLEEVDQTHKLCRAKGLDLKVHSASCFQTNDGRLFVRAVDHLVRNQCEALGIPFVSSAEEL
jgi:GNAT superfamily N-acetyltransferase